MKAAQAFRTISEVAEELDVPKHVLRFWEMRFPQIKPMKRGGGRRYYRPADVELLKGIRHLLHAEGYTIKGVQKILRDQGLEEVQHCWNRAASAAPAPVEPAQARPAGRPAARSRPRLVAVERGRATPSERLKAMRQIIAELEVSRDRLEALLPAASPERAASAAKAERAERAAAKPRAGKAPSKTVRARGAR